MPEASKHKLLLSGSWMLQYYPISPHSNCPQYIHLTASHHQDRALLYYTLHLDVEVMSYLTSLCRETKSICSRCACVQLSLSCKIEVYCLCIQYQGYGASPLNSLSVFLMVRSAWFVTHSKLIASMIRLPWKVLPTRFCISAEKWTDL